MSDEVKVGPDVSWVTFLMSLTRAMADKLLRWCSIALSAGVVAVVMFRPMPWWAVAVAAGFVGLLAPLWLRRDG